MVIYCKCTQLQATKIQNNSCFSSVSLQKSNQPAQVNSDISDTTKQLSGKILRWFSSEVML